MVELSPTTIAAQQALSEKFGIPTFTLTGDISTVPTGGRLSRINVGTGKFTGETVQSFTTKLDAVINQIRNIGGSIGNTIFTGGGQTTPTPRGGTRTGGLTQGPGAATTETDKFIDAIDQLKTTIGPSGLILGAVLLAVLVLKR